MSGQEFAGRLRERVVLLRQAATRDAIGNASGAWGEIGTMWAWLEIEGALPLEQGAARSALPLWRVTMRPCAVTVGDRIARGASLMTVRAVRRDPALRDRVVAIGEEMR